jgi:hypothetical protein
MDRSITPLLSELAKNLLVTSPRFEPYVPQSQHNTVRALQFLEALGILTQTSLQPKSETHAPSLQTPLSGQPLSKNSAPVSTSSPQPAATPSPPLSKDQQLLEALLKLRNSQSTMRRPTGLSRPIIRNQQT